MTLAKPPQTDCRKLSRRVSSYTLSGSESEDDKLKDEVSSKPMRERLTRQVSNDLLLSVASTKDVTFGRKSPIRCVTEFDKASGSVLDDASKGQATLALQLNIDDGGLVENPLTHERMLVQHAYSLRLEAELHPLRLILSRLMAHITLNRKGLFNHPVDPVALNLTDYFSIIKKPMDLGTVRRKLHSLEYHSAREVVDDIRLVFHNAMQYNPSHHVVHISANGLLLFFEEQLEAFVPGLTLSESSFIAGESSLALNDDELADEAGRCSTSRHRMAESVYKQATRNATSLDIHDTSFISSSRKRKKRGARTDVNHDCFWCEGRICSLCNQGCLHVEPALLICSGASCVGSKIRKGAVYYVARDGSRQYCQKCFAGLPAALPRLGSHDGNCSYKKDLLKRKNDEEIVERWITCLSCDSAVHKVCAMHNEYACEPGDYRCHECVSKRASMQNDARSSTKANYNSYTFLTGSPSPIKMSELLGDSMVFGDQHVTAEGLPSTSICSFIELKVRELMESNGFSEAAKTVTVRTISDCEKTFHVPEVVRKHFRMQRLQDCEDEVPPSCVPYQSKAIALFQKIDGMDVCIFCMYVQEYEGLFSQPKRVYIAYLDSVEHFRPRTCRTKVYQEVLVSYLATARKRGFESAHIWACPPSRGNSFVFWNHPSSQRTPTKERLISWYHGALSRAMECGIVTDVTSLYESSFEDTLEKIEEKQRLGVADAVHASGCGKLKCPPLLEGDFWVEEAVRLHSQYFARNLRASMDNDMTLCEVTPDVETCPASQVAHLLRNIMTSHPAAQPFRRPVNAAAMNLTDYHKIISRPMDLGTVYSRCVLGEYEELGSLVSDVKLVFSNAKLYNPKGHYVHSLAEELEEYFFSELDKMANNWCLALQREDFIDWEKFAKASLSLDATLRSTFETDLLRCGKIENAACDKCSDAASGVSRFSQVDQQCVATDGDCFTGGTSFIQRRMIGGDTWLLDKRSPTPKDLKSTSQKNQPGRKRKSCSESEECATKRRRQSWLGEEIGAAVRLMRESFFCCSLTARPPEKASTQSFNVYTRNYSKNSTPSRRTTSRVADARHSLLEFLQFRNLEFDTLRRAKYSTATLLHHLHFGDASGLIPKCSDCNMAIEDVRWHRVCRVVERRQSLRPPPKCVRLTAPVGAESSEPEELCSSCLSARTNKDAYVPFQVSFKL